MNRRVAARLAWVSCLAIISAALPLIAAAPANADPAPCRSRAPLPAGLANELAASYPGRRFSIEVRDISGCQYTLNPDLRISTASVVKMEFMAGVLLRAQNEGRGLTQWEHDRIWPMITQSDDNAASQLWQYLGQDPGMQQVDAAFGLTQTQHSGSVWGLTTTSVADQIKLVGELIPGLGGPLAPQYHASAKFYMSNVTPSQRWGASAGVPSGSTVSQKNGFAGSQCCGWRLNSVGWVDRPGGSGWAIAVMSDGWSTEQQGIDAVNALSARINRVMVDPYFAGASASFSDANHEYLFARNGAGNVMQRTWSASGGFGSWTNIGGYATSDPDSAAPDASSKPNVFVVGGDSALYEGLATSQGYGYVSLGGICMSGPSATYSGPDRLDVFCRGTDGQPWTRTWRSSSGWSGWTAVGGLITADPDAASTSDATTLRLFGRGADNAVWVYTPQGGKWMYQSLGGTCTTGPTAVYSGAARLDVVCRGIDGQPWTRRWSPSTGWAGWTPMGGAAASDLDAVSQGDGFAPQIFGRGLDGAVWQWLASGGGWVFQSWGLP